MISLISLALMLTIQTHADTKGVCEIDVMELMYSAHMEQAEGKNAKGTYLIEDITPGTYFEKSGLRNGDVIMELNGKTFRSQAEIIAAFNFLQPKNIWKIRRKGKELKLPFSCPLK
jgi:S1-C subfamily serine protease